MDENYRINEFEQTRFNDEGDLCFQNVDDHTRSFEGLHSSETNTAEANMNYYPDVILGADNSPCIFL